jgi:hypothetical protein
MRRRNTHTFFSLPKSVLGDEWARHARSPTAKITKS